MKKAFVVMIAAILVFGAAGCKSLQGGYETPSASAAEVSAAQDVISEADIENADSIANAINAYNALNPNSMLPDGITLEQAKETVGELLWPQRLTGEETKAAWKLVAYKDDIAQVSREAAEAWLALKDLEDESGQTGDADALRYAASSIAAAVNAYNCLRPNSVIPDGVTLEGVKETLGADGLWPRWLSDGEASGAWKLIDYRDGIAEVSAAPDVISEADIENAANIATAINAYNALNPNSVLPDNTTLEDAKEIVDGQDLWPQKLSDEDAGAAWKLIDYKDGIAMLTREAEEAAQGLREEQEQGQAGNEESLTLANASNIATAINAYNALNPDSVLPDGISLEEAKEIVDGKSLWPQKLSDEDAKEAWSHIVYKDGIAEIKETD